MAILIPVIHATSFHTDKILLEPVEMVDNNKNCYFNLAIPLGPSIVVICHFITRELTLNDGLQRRTGEYPRHTGRDRMGLNEMEQED